MVETSIYFFHKCILDAYAAAVLRDRIFCRRSVNMGAANYKNKNFGEKEWQYNWQHVVLVTNKRRNFRKEYDCVVARSAIEEAAHTYGIIIKEFSFDDDYAHIHMEIGVPNTLSMSQVIQILKSHSVSAIFQKIPNFIKLYPGAVLGRLVQ